MCVLLHFVCSVCSVCVCALFFLFSNFTPDHAIHPFCAHFSSIVMVLYTDGLWLVSFFSSLLLPIYRSVNRSLFSRWQCGALNAENLILYENVRCVCDCVFVLYRNECFECLCDGFVAMLTRWQPNQACSKMLEARVFLIPKLYSESSSSKRIRQQPQKKTKKTKLRSVAKCMLCVFFSSPTLASHLRWDGNFFTSPLNFYNTHWTLEYVNLHLKYTHNARFFYCFAVRLTCQTHIWKSDFWMRGFEVFLTWFFFFFDVYMDWNQIICNKKM